MKSYNSIMNLRYTFGLILFLVLIRNSIHETVDDENEQAYDDYYDDYDLNQTETDQTSPPTTETTTTTTPGPSSTPRPSTTNFPEVSYPLFFEMPIIQLLNCPERCQCSRDFTLVDCSNQSFENVPLDLPQIVEKLNLSSNRISKLDDSDFANLTNLKELVLDGNLLNEVDFQNFTSLSKLKYLSLVNNGITKINPNAFVNLIVLETLNLSSNAIVISDDLHDSFLNQPNLKELNLSHCQVSSLSDEILKNLSGLIALDLEHNEMEEKINTKAFEPMQKLMKLKLPELESNVIVELCKILTAIDLIGFPQFDVSCFELEAGSSFDDSTIRAKQLVENMSNTDGTDGNRTQEETLKTETAAGAKANSEPTKVNRNGEKSIDDAEVIRKKTISPTSMDSTHTNGVNTTTIANSTVTGTDIDSEEDYKVAISQQTINQILIGIIIVAVTGIIIGIICRRDICGIKTKLCRTRRPPPTDQVRPAEEIPLNKVEVIR